MVLVQREDARGRLRTCQETVVLYPGGTINGHSIEQPVPCGAAATTIIDNGDEQPYWMCDEHADHNLTNRRAIELVPAHERRR